MITRENIKSLKPGDSISLVEGGRIYPYKFLAIHPTVDCYFFAYNSGDAGRFFIPKEGLSDWYIGYDSKFLGEVAIAQLKKRIKSINKVYISK